MKIFICSAYILLALEPLHAKALAPLGKRKYLLDPKRPERPAQIEGIDAPASNLEAGVMRDPIPLGAKIELPKKAWKEAPPVAAKTSSLKFEKVAVSGRYAVPRVPLDKNSRELRHANEPVRHDYRKKVEDSEQILKDLNW